jgi:hypothetical protein
MGHIRSSNLMRLLSISGANGDPRPAWKSSADRSWHDPRRCILMQISFVSALAAIPARSAKQSLGG